MLAFGYGTLLFKSLVELLIGHDVKMEWATLRGYKRCTILDRKTGASGPAIRSDADSEVRGKILHVVPEDWTVLDDFENYAGGYTDRVCSIETDAGEPVDVKFYVADESVIELGGEWSELEFFENHDWGFAHYHNFRILNFLRMFWNRNPTLKARWPANTIELVSRLPKDEN